MNPCDLPKLGAITNQHHDFFHQYSDLSGKHLLCIGLSEFETTQYVANHDPASITLLTNWTDHGDAKVSKFPLVIGDITKRTQFDDDSFDSVLTLSVLEHLSDVRSAFREMTRLLKPGGEMLHMFGPAWSSPYGHHIYARENDRLLNFSFWEMPAHMHLLCSHDEIRRYFNEQGYEESIGWDVLYWFFEAPLINRVFYDEYFEIMLGDCYQIDKMELMYNEVPNDHLRRLRQLHPGKRDFSTYGGRYRLIVRK